MSSIQQVFTHLDFGNVAEIRNPRINPVSSDPASPVTSVIWYNTTENRWKYFDGTSIKTVANLSDISSISPIHVGASPPVVTDGTVEWNNTTPGYEGKYFRDQTRNKWLGPPMAFHCGEDFADNNNLGFAGITNAGNFTGYNLNFNLTITEIYASCRDINNATKSVELRQRLGDSGTFSNLFSFNLIRLGTAGNSPGYFENRSLDIDLPAAQRQIYFNVSGTGSSSSDVVVTLVVRKRGT